MNENSVPNHQYFLEKREGKTFFVTKSSLSVSNRNWQVEFSIPYDNIINSLHRSNLLYFVAIIVAIIVAILLSAIMVKSIAQRFQILVNKMNSLRQGDMTLLETKNMGNDELGRLNGYFDEMAADFIAMIEDNYVKQLLITQTQLKSLEQQVNPHFLYNCLETIRWLAHRSGEENIPHIVESLGNLLRNSLGKQEEVVTIEKETAIIEDYLRIQRIRFADSLHIVMDISPDTLSLVVPKLSIQPLVENAIVHALEETLEECSIYVQVTQEQEMLRVRVENSGSEITEDIMERLHSQKKETNGNGTGLLNIDTRLRILFGEDCGLSFVQAGDKVTVSFAISALTKDAYDQRKGEEYGHAHYDYRR